MLQAPSSLLFCFHHKCVQTSGTVSCPWTTAGGWFAKEHGGGHYQGLCWSPGILFHDHHKTLHRPKRSPKLGFLSAVFRMPTELTALMGRSHRHHRGPLCWVPALHLCCSVSGHGAQANPEPSQREPRKLQRADAEHPAGEVSSIQERKKQR